MHTTNINSQQLLVPFMPKVYVHYTSQIVRCNILTAEKLPS